MSLYVDGYVLPVPKKNLAAYRKMAKACGKIYRELGAVQFCECVGDDLKVKMGLPFPRLVKPKAGETVLFSWIAFKSKADRNRIIAKIMKDPRIDKMMQNQPMPFDVKRMAYGGFKVIVEA